MGKDNLLLGTARGKLGSVVFYRTGGEQRFRTHVKPMNPRTNAQLLQRCVVSTAVKYYSSIINIADHAFQGYSGKLKNNQRYMRLAIKKLRNIALSNVRSFSPIIFNTMQHGNWAIKDDTNIPINPVQISEGDLPEMSFATYNELEGNNEIPALFGVNITGSTSYADIASQLGLNIGDQLTFVIQSFKEGTAYIDRTWIARVILMPDSGDPNTTPFLQTVSGEGTWTTIRSQNKENYGNIHVAVNKTGDALYVMPSELGADYKFIGAFGVIVSRYENALWRRSNCTMYVNPDIQDIMPLRSAMETYLKADTSSLYLNQATTGERASSPRVLMEQEGLQIMEEKGLSEVNEEAKKASRKHKE